MVWMGSYGEAWARKKTTVTITHTTTIIATKRLMEKASKLDTAVPLALSSMLRLSHRCPLISVAKAAVRGERQSPLPSPSHLLFDCYIRPVVGLGSQSLEGGDQAVDLRIDHGVA